MSLLQGILRSKTENIEKTSMLYVATGWLWWRSRQHCTSPFLSSRSIVRSNARAAGRIFANVLILCVRPIILIGFSLVARVIFYALVELAKQKQFGIVQDVFLLGAVLTVSLILWCETCSVVSRRYVNAFARNNWCWITYSESRAEASVLETGDECARARDCRRDG